MKFIQKVILISIVFAGMFIAAKKPDDSKMKIFIDALM